jgi:hypothetical protein
MSVSNASVLPRKRVWRAFWLIWLVIFVGLNGYLSFIVSRAHPFNRKYILGADELNETHRLSWLAWGAYSVEIRELEPRYQNGMGGDMAVEIVSDSGATIIPRRFVFGEKGATTAGTRGDTFFWSFGGFRTGMFDRYTMRVTTVNTGAFPRRNVELVLAGSDAGYAFLAFMVWNVLAVVVLVLSIIILAIALRVIARKQRRGEPVSRAKPTPEGLIGPRGP